MDLDAIPPAPREPSPRALQLFFGPGMKIARLIGAIFLAVGCAVSTILYLSTIPLAFMGIGLVFVVVGLSLFLGATSARRRKERAFRIGEPAAGKVVFLGIDRHTRINGAFPYQLKWEFSAGAGNYTGSISSMNEQALKELPQNGEVPVLYDPANPRNNTLYVD
jgi:hypothetical protein